MAKKKHYVNNADLHAALLAWADDDKPRPIPDYIAESIVEIVHRFGSKPNYVNYPNDMRSMAVEICIRYCDRYDGTRWNNPFAYFTQQVYHSFLQFIAKEKKYARNKFNLIKDEMENSGQYDRSTIVMHNHNDDGNPMDENGNELNKFIYGTRKRKSKQRK